MSTTAPLTSLVNEAGVRSAIKRLFSNTMVEAVAELFQNSQRAGATTVNLVTFDEGFTYVDNGAGIQDGLNGFHALLRMADSKYDEAVIANQHPMGLGFHALLALDSVDRVVIASNGLLMDIDTKRWWEDPSYFSNWADLVTHAEAETEVINGFGITVYGSDVAYQLSKCLPTDPDTIETHKTVTQYAALGYEGLLTITKNGKPAVTAVPERVLPKEPFATVDYQGNKLVVGFGEPYGRSWVNWYGQLISVGGGDAGSIQYYLEVRTGRPVSPKSPVRSGLIYDDAYYALLEKLKDMAFVQVCDVGAEFPSARAVRALYGIDHERASRVCPYFVGKPYLPLQEYPDTPGETKLTAEGQVLRYMDMPLVLNDEIKRIDEDDDTVTQKYGMASFIEALDLTAYKLDVGDTKLIVTKTLYWKPGGELDAHGLFAEKPGLYAIIPEDADIEAPLDEGEESRWKAFPEGLSTPLFAFENAATDSLGDTDAVIWAPNAIEFLRGNVNYLVSDRRDSEDRESFHKSVEARVRAMIGNCVPREFVYGDLQALFGHTDSPVGVAYTFENGPTNEPSHVEVTSRGGVVVKVALI